MHLIDSIVICQNRSVNCLSGLCAKHRSLRESLSIYLSISELVTCYLLPVIRYRTLGSAASSAPPLPFNKCYGSYNRTNKTEPVKVLQVKHLSRKCIRLNTCCNIVPPCSKTQHKPNISMFCAAQPVPQDRKTNHLSGD